MIDITDRDCRGALRTFNGDGLETLGMETSAEKMRSSIEECVQKSERVLIQRSPFRSLLAKRGFFALLRVAEKKVSVQRPRTPA
jgi:hypothetical protein